MKNQSGSNVLKEDGMMKRLIVLLGLLFLAALTSNVFALPVSVDSVQGKQGDRGIAVPISINDFTAADRASGVPLGAVFSPKAHTFFWAPSGVQSGAHSVVFTVKDAASGKTASQTACIKIRVPGII